ncbi:MAG TPA: glycosyltransferase [Candidatus Eisenbacteria bacterium]|nr:glycosyltransferase [Candidatus Eisenbacteria bacterium]
MKIFVVPATYNEKDNIEKFITVLEEEVFPKIENHDMHILVADDFSPDGTGDIVKHLMKKYKNLGINQGERKGLGAAYIRTMGHAIEKEGADVVVSIDADFQFDPFDLIKYVKKLEEGYDMVVQTRYSGGGSIPENWPPQRKVFSIVANLFVRVVFMKLSIHDWTGGFRAITKKVFLTVAPKMKGFNGYIFQIAFLHRAVRDGFTVGEVPLHFSDRKLGSSKIAPLSYILDVVKFVVGTRLRELKRFIEFLIVGGTGFIVQVGSQEISVALHAAHPLAVGIGAEAAIVSNFLLNNFWTFSDTKKLKQNSNFFVKFVEFNITSMASIFIQIAAVWIAERILGVNMHLLSYTLPTRIVVLFPTIIFLVIPLNYLIYNKLIWKTQYLKDGASQKK